MTKKRKSRKRVRNRIKNRKNARRRRKVRHKLKKDIFSVTDLFKNIDIDPLEDILESIKITTLPSNILPIHNVQWHIQHPITNFTPLPINQSRNDSHDVVVQP